ARVEDGERVGALRYLYDPRAAPRRTGRQPPAQAPHPHGGSHPLRRAESSHGRGCDWPAGSVTVHFETGKPQVTRWGHGGPTVGWGYREDPRAGRAYGH